MKQLLLACLLVTALAGANAQAQGSLADLIQNGEREAALALIGDGADVNASQGDGTTPLHWAVYKVDHELVRELLDAGAKADVANAYGSSALAEAVKLGDLELVRALLDAGADVESPNGDGQTVLMLAARAGALDVAKLLVERGADLNAQEAWRSQTALMWAVDGNYPELAQFLIAAGADVSARAAANTWDSQITSEPRAQYRPVGGLTVLLYAARSGCTRCVRSLLEAGAPIDQPTPEGITPLMLAIDNLRFDTARVLLDAGANAHVWDWYGRTALYIAVDMSTYQPRLTQQPVATSETSATDLIRLLLEKGVNPNAQLNMHRPSRGGNIGRFTDDLLTTGATPLLRAAVGADVPTVRLLLEHGALVDLPNVMGVTPLMAASGMGVSGRDRRFDAREQQARTIEVLDLLLAAGADINARVTDIDGRTARIARPSTMTERLGQTALFGAVKFGWTGVVEYLLAHGADPAAADALGKTPLDAAQGRIGGRDNVVSEEVAALLRAALANGPIAAR